jgi:predicted RNase H-like HicB family nuclease
MREVYPVVIKKTEGAHPYTVYIPAFDTMTQGDSLSNAIHMARDAIGLRGIDCQEDGIPIPSASTLNPPHNEGDIITLVDVDFVEYKRKHDMRTVRRNVTIPAWLDTAASKAHINVSAVLKTALVKELDLDDNHH